MLCQKQRSGTSFVGSVKNVLIWEMTSVNNGSKRLRTISCRSSKTETEHNCKTFFPSSRMLPNQPFTCVYVPWERFKRRETVSHVLNDREAASCQNACKSCSPGKNGSFFCIKSWQAMKSEYFLIIRNGETVGWSRPAINIFLRTKPLYTKDDAVCLMISAGYRLL